MDEAIATRRTPGVRLTSTFTAEPVFDVIRFWMTELGLGSDLKSAPAYQVMQNLLDPAGLLAQNAEGVNVVLFRWEDFLHGTTSLEGALTDFASALRAGLERSKVPYLVVATPPSPRALAANSEAAFAAMDAAVAREFATELGPSFVTTDELLRAYPVVNRFESYADQIAQVPYTGEMFAGLGTMVARKLASIVLPSKKAIIVDCDDTLWVGACAEEGPAGVILDSAAQALQRLLVAQRAAGKIICLCSKNAEEDVRAVFQRREDFPLRWEHITAHRINWMPKPENVRALATELSLGFDSLVMIDDNPRECAELRVSLPEVTTLEPPRDRVAWPRFFEGVWPFDSRKLTVEDAERATRYEQSRERARLRRSAGTIEEFLESLQLKVRVSQVAGENAARASQLTYRVNQFNPTGRRRTEADILAALRSGVLEGLAFEVSDRFGDYGLVGLTLFEVTADALRVDAYLLSCRALGRGVEHRMLAELGRVAEQRARFSIEIPFSATPRNQPVRDFLDSLSGVQRQAAGPINLYRLSAVDALSARYRPGKDAVAVASNSVDESKQRDERVLGDLRVWIDFARIATDLSEASQVLAVVARKSNQVAVPAISPDEPASLRALRSIWLEVLGMDKVESGDDFFDIGGDSIKMVQVIARVEAALGIEFPVDAFFEKPTLADHAGLIAELQGVQARAS